MKTGKKLWLWCALVSAAPALAADREPVNTPSPESLGMKIEIGDLRNTPPVEPGRVKDISVWDEQGNPVTRISPMKNEASELSGLPAGTYTLRYTYSDGFTLLRRIILY